ncbi:putative CPA1 family transporter [Nocardia brasiliensis NBRC 14402]|uniref:Na+/H+ antiporter n=1 Tax=Nocardia brasiliensis TaxID=37326 RepID=UPI0002D3BB17|nr:Na+/H+ antiporter [Nocardia brasiliensis]ASF07473.1 Na+/H+ antiporter [Nocardia brasiliensis]GAJ79567.1 putative CPA1 family transporter [Nocardia brasiliensis NBRC 14402]SUB55591.1 Sodium, potassium, lithium and rubidium/H(+) antiporter [Nocardia brasiliensis]
MHVAIGLVVLVASAAALAALARRFGLSEPLVLTLAGVAASYLPFVPEIHPDPEIILLGLLPPLLYTAAIRTSLVDFRANVRAIVSLSVGLVLFTTFAVAAVVWWLLPVPFAVAVAVGAVVAPPDAVAATAVARRIGMPRQIVTILESESLFNDATALVALRTAIAASAGAVSVWTAGGDFLLAAGGGAAVGVAVAYLLALLRRRISDPVLDTTLSFLAPFAAYLPAEGIHASGVIAVVTCGMILGHGAPVWQSAASRIAERTNWRTIQFILESSVFVIIGLQVRAILEGAWSSGLDHRTLVLTAVAVLVTVMLARPLWIFPWSLLVRRLGRSGTVPLEHSTVVSWAGMRGVVTLAAVLLLPEDTPQLPVLKLLALVVVAGTLLMQGTSLPWLVRLIRLRGPSRAEDALRKASLLQQATSAGLAALDNAITPDTPPGVVQQLRDRVAWKANAAWERLGRAESESVTPTAEYRRLRLAMLAAERETVLRVRDSGGLDYEILQHVLARLDLEESMIDRYDEADDDRVEPLAVPMADSCAHLRAAPLVMNPDEPDECAECLAEGLSWVHLRMCLACGHIACCDSSEGNHATKHYAGSGHPVMRSVEPGEAWRWCYVDELLG